MMCFMNARDDVSRRRQTKTTRLHLPQDRRRDQNDVSSKRRHTQMTRQRRRQVKTTPDQNDAAKTTSRRNPNDVRSKRRQRQSTSKPNDVKPHLTRPLGGRQEGENSDCLFVRVARVPFQTRYSMSMSKRATCPH